LPSRQKKRNFRRGSSSSVTTRHRCQRLCLQWRKDQPGVSSHLARRTQGTSRRTAGGRLRRSSRARGRWANSRLPRASTTRRRVTERLSLVRWAGSGKPQNAPVTLCRRVLQTFGDARGGLAAFATAGYRRRLGREKSPKGKTPTARGPSGRWDVKGRLRTEGPLSVGGPALPCRKPRAMEGAGRKPAVSRSHWWERRRTS
jgi:hypothetical protein